MKNRPLLYTRYKEVVRKCSKETENRQVMSLFLCLLRQKTIYLLRGKTVKAKYDEEECLIVKCNKNYTVIIIKHKTNNKQVITNHTK